MGILEIGLNHTTSQQKVLDKQSYIYLGMTKSVILYLFHQGWKQVHHWAEKNIQCCTNRYNFPRFDTDNSISRHFCGLEKIEMDNDIPEKKRWRTAPVFHSLCRPSHGGWRLYIHLSFYKDVNLKWIREYRTGHKKFLTFFWTSAPQP